MMLRRVELRQLRSLRTIDCGAFDFAGWHLGTPDEFKSFLRGHISTRRNGKSVSPLRGSVSVGTRFGYLSKEGGVCPTA